jgi:hypothetical protein
MSGAAGQLASIGEHDPKRQMEQLGEELVIADHVECLNSMRRCCERGLASFTRG